MNWIAELIKTLCVATIFALSAAVSIALSRAGADFATLWLANGAALMSIRLLGMKAPWIAYLAIYIVGLATNLAFENSPDVSAVLMIINLIEIAIASYVLKSEAIERNRRYTVYFQVVLGAIILPSLVSASLAATFFYFKFEAEFFKNFSLWFDADAAGLLFIVLLNVLIERRKEFDKPRIDWQGVSVILIGALLPIWIAMNVPFPYIWMALCSIFIASWFPPLLVFAASLFYITLLVLVAIYAPSFSENYRILDATGETLFYVNLAMTSLPAVILSHLIRNLEREIIVARENKDRFSRAMNDSHLGFVIADMDGRILAANPAMEKLLGYPSAELVGMTALDLTPDEFKQQSRETTAKIAHGDADMVQQEKQYQRKDGSLIWARFTASLIAGSGQPYSVVQIEDISDQKAMQAETQQQEDRWRFALEAARQGVWDADLTLGQTHYSVTWCRILGFDQSEIGRSSNRWLDFVHPDDKRRVRAVYLEHISGEIDIFEEEYRMRHKDGHWVWVLNRGKTIAYDETGKPVRIVGTQTDISRLKMAEQERLSDHEKITVAADSANLGFWEYDPISRNFKLDAAASALTNAPDNISADVFFQDFLDIDRQISPETFLEKETFHFEAASGGPGLKTQKKLEFFGRQMRNPDDSISIVGICIDVTRLANLIETLSDKNEQLDKFAAIASHDLQSPLRHIRMQSEMLELELDASVSEETRAMIGTIRSSSAEMQELIQKLLDFSRSNDAIEVGTVDVSACISQAIKKVDTDVKESGAVIRTDTKVLINADGELLGEVFQNLIQNAIKYRSQSVPEIDITLDENATEFVFTVRDNGRGIPLQHKDYIFEPFRRLLQPDNVTGSGMGLALCARIVRAHKGKIWLHQSSQDGSTFRFSISKRL